MSYLASSGRLPLFRAPKHGQTPSSGAFFIGSGLAKLPTLIRPIWDIFCLRTTSPRGLLKFCLPTNGLSSTYSYGKNEHIVSRVCMFKKKNSKPISWALFRLLQEPCGRRQKMRGWKKWVFSLVQRGLNCLVMGIMGMFAFSAW